jgi:hypothetical protein
VGNTAPLHYGRSGRHSRRRQGAIPRRFGRSPRPSVRRGRGLRRMIHCRHSALFGALGLCSGCAATRTTFTARLLGQQLTSLVLVQQPLVEQAQRSEAQVRRLLLHHYFWNLSAMNRVNLSKGDFLVMRFFGWVWDFLVALKFRVQLRSYSRKGCVT